MFSRTFHPDEANQAFTVGRLLDTGHYRYDPADHHGPTLYYAAAPIQRAFGHDSTTSLDGTLLRCTPLVFAVLLLVILVSLARRCAFSAKILCKALPVLLVATAPFFVFFATDFIQEMLLACFLVATGAFVFWRKPWWAGLAAGLACATKETCVLSFVAAGLAWFLANRRRPDRDRCILAVLVCGLTCVLFYSSFCADWSGIWRVCVSAPCAYFSRAAGEASSAAWHVHPWWKHFEWLFASGWRFSLLPAAALFALTWSRKSFLHLYVLLLFACYAAIPYKTPWCALQLVIPLLLAPFFGGVWRMPPLAYGLLALQLALNVCGDVRMWHDPDSSAIPCNYAHASPEVKELATRIEAKLAASPHAFAAVALPASDTWPLPFYLRAVSDRVGYWESTEALFATVTNAPGSLAAVVVPMEEGHRAQPLFPDLRETSRHAIRPGVRARLFR